PMTPGGRGGAPGGPGPRAAAVPRAAVKACPHGGSSATRTTSSCSCTASAATPKPCAKKSLLCSNRWDCGCQKPKPRSCVRHARGGGGLRVGKGPRYKRCCLGGGGWLDLRR